MTSEVNISMSLTDVDQTFITRFESEMRLACFMIFAYSIGPDVNQFVELIRNNNNQLWIIT